MKTGGLPSLLPLSSPCTLDFLSKPAASAQAEGILAPYAGIVQMNGGIILSWFNQRYFRDSLSTWCEFVPQLVFLNSLFGYLCILIIAKWASGSIADLYHVMIYMFLSPGNGGLECTVDAQGHHDCKDSLLAYPWQGYLQASMRFLALQINGQRCLTGTEHGLGMRSA